MKKFFSIFLSLSLVGAGMLPYVFSGYYLAIPGNTEIGVNPAALLDQPITEKELAALLGFEDIDILIKHGFGMADFRAAIKKGPIKECIMDKFFIAIGEGLYKIKHGVTSKDFDTLLLKDYYKVSAFYRDKDGLFFHNIFIEFLTTHTYAGIVYILEDLILRSFSSNIIGPYAQGNFPEFELESANSPEELLSRITNSNFFSRNNKVSDETIEKVMQIFKHLPEHKQITIAYNGLRQTIPYLKHIQGYHTQRKAVMEKDSSMYKEESAFIERIKTAINRIKHNIESLTPNLTTQENILDAISNLRFSSPAEPISADQIAKNLGLADRSLIEDKLHQLVSEGHLISYITSAELDEESSARLIEASKLRTKEQIDDRTLYELEGELNKKCGGERFVLSLSELKKRSFLKDKAKAIFHDRSKLESYAGQIINLFGNDLNPTIRAAITNAFHSVMDEHFQQLVKKLNEKLHSIRRNYDIYRKISNTFFEIESTFNDIDDDTLFEFFILVSDKMGAMLPDIENLSKFHLEKLNIDDVSREIIQKGLKAGHAQLTQIYDVYSMLALEIVISKFTPGQFISYYTQQIRDLFLPYITEAEQIVENLSPQKPIQAQTKVQLKRFNTFWEIPYTESFNNIFGQLTNESNKAENKNYEQLVYAFYNTLFHTIATIVSGIRLETTNSIEFNEFTDNSKERIKSTLKRFKIILDRLSSLSEVRLSYYYCQTLFRPGINKVDEFPTVMVSFDDDISELFNKILPKDANPQKQPSKNPSQNSL